MLSNFVGRAARRLTWALYVVRVVIRRRTLDFFLSQRRRAALLEESCVYRDDDEVVFRIAPPVSIEPRYGYVVRGRFGVIEESLMASEYVRLPDMRVYFSGVPTVLELTSGDWMAAKFAGPLVSIGHAFAHNYYHAVIDCIGALALIDEHDELADARIVIDPDLYETPMFRTMLDRGLLDADRLIVRREWMRSNESVSFVRHDSRSPRSLRRTAEFIGRVAPAVSDGDAESKLYLTRGRLSDGRVLRNEAELIPELERRGFEVIDPGLLPWDTQYERFRAASHVVGVHGAALTNLLYRYPANVAILEITLPRNDGEGEVFREMAEALGFPFTRIEGSAASGSGNRASFVVDVAAVLAVVDRWRACEDQNF